MALVSKEPVTPRKIITSYYQSGLISSLIKLLCWNLLPSLQPQAVNRTLLPLHHFGSVIFPEHGLVASLSDRVLIQKMGLFGILYIIFRLFYATRSWILQRIDNRWWGSNRGFQLSEATAQPTAPQPFKRKWWALISPLISFSVFLLTSFFSGCF